MVSPLPFATPLTLPLLDLLDFFCPFNQVVNLLTSKYFSEKPVMIDRTLTHLGADRSFHIRSHPFHPLRQQRAFVTFCESNAKALLTAEPSKGAVALSEGQGEPFEKGSLASPPKPCVSVRVDGDGLFETATGTKNIVTTVTHRHAAPAGVRPADPRDCVCSSTGSRIPETNARR